MPVVPWGRPAGGPAPRRSRSGPVGRERADGPPMASHGRIFKLELTSQVQDDAIAKLSHGSEVPSQPAAGPASS